MTKEKSSIEHRLYSEKDRGSLRFYQLSKEIVLNDKYETLSHGATLLYALLFDRLQLSISNNRKDDQGRYYLQFKVKPAQGDLRPRKEKPQAERSLTEVLRSNAKTITKYKKELKDAELLLEVKEGLGKVSRLYLAKPCTGEDTPPETAENPTLEGNLPIGATDKTSQGEGVLSLQTTQKVHPSEGILPPQTTRILPHGGGIITPQRGSELPPNDTDLNKTYSNDTDLSEINPSKENETTNKNCRLNSLNQEPLKAREGMKTHDEVHQVLQEKYGKELLGEAITIIKRQNVSTFGYEKYLSKILEDLTGRKKSQINFQSSPKVDTHPQPQPTTPGSAKKSYHLRKSRYRDLSEDVLNARIEAKNAASRDKSSVTS